MPWIAIFQSRNSLGIKHNYYQAVYDIEDGDEARAHAEHDAGSTDLLRVLTFAPEDSQLFRQFHTMRMSGWDKWNPFAARLCGDTSETSAPGPRKIIPQVCPEVWRTKPINPEAAWAAIQALCAGQKGAL